MSSTNTVHSYSLYPIKDLAMYKLGKQQEARLWSVADLKSFAIDRDDYLHRLCPKRKSMIEKVFMYFVPVDGVVNAGHMTRTALDCRDTCEQFCMAMQIAIEAVHAETYGISAQIVFGNTKLNELMIEAENTAVIQEKITYSEKYIDSSYSLCEYLLAFACTEGIFISVSFIFIFWFRSQGLLPAMIHSNSMISEDEMLHQLMAVTRYLKYGGLPAERAAEIILEAMEIEERYIDWVLPEAISDLTPEDVKTYLKLVVDYLFMLIGLPKRFNVQNPFSWDNDRSLYKKPNPYERESGQYCRFSVEEVLDRILNETGTGTNHNSEHIIDPWSVEGI